MVFDRFLGNLEGLKCNLTNVGLFLRSGNLADTWRGLGLWTFLQILVWIK